MGWIIIRRKQDRFQLYMDKNETPPAGEWRDSGNGLPMVFDAWWRALHQMYKLEGTDREWEYEVEEYLR